IPLRPSTAQAPVIAATALAADPGANLDFSWQPFWKEQPMRPLLIASACALAFASVGAARADNYPSRPITMVVPLPAGAAFDVTARLLAARMQVSLGQPIIVENLTGASGSIGAGH